MSETVAILFARRDSCYKTMPNVDVYDIDRYARSFAGGMPCIAHPPCRAWGRLRHFAHPRPDEKTLAFFALSQVRKWGGVLEHPAASTLWKEAGLPPVGRCDRWGFSIQVNQHWWGHRAEKKTWLYLCGIDESRVNIPLKLDYPTHVVQSRKARSLPHIAKAEREHTPLALAVWLVDLAREAGAR